MLHLRIIVRSGENTLSHKSYLITSYVDPYNYKDKVQSGGRYGQKILSLHVIIFKMTSFSPISYIKGHRELFWEWKIESCLQWVKINPQWAELAFFVICNDAYAYKIEKRTLFIKNMLQKLYILPAKNVHYDVRFLRIYVSLAWT